MSTENTENTDFEAAIAAQLTKLDAAREQASNDPVEGFSGFAEAMRALKFAGVGGSTELDGVALTLIKDRELEAAKNQTRDSLIAQMAGQFLLPEIRVEMEKRIETALGSATNMAAVRAVGASIGAGIREAANWSAAEKNLNDQQNRERQIEQLLSDICNLDDKMRKQEKDVVAHYGTEEQQETLAELQKKVDDAKKADDKEAQQKAYAELFAYRAELYPELRKKALAQTPPDWDAVRIMDGLMDGAKEGLDKTSQLEELRADIVQKRKNVNYLDADFDWGTTPNKTGNEEKVTHLPKKQDGLGMTEDDWSKPLASADQGKEVTMDDVSAPPIGQKQKSTDRTV